MKKLYFLLLLITCWLFKAKVTIGVLSLYLDEHTIVVSTWMGYYSYLLDNSDSCVEYVYWWISNLQWLLVLGWVTNHICCKKEAWTWEGSDPLLPNQLLSTGCIPVEGSCLRDQSLHFPHSFLFCSAMFITYNSKTTS